MGPLVGPRLPVARTLTSCPLLAARETCVLAGHLLRSQGLGIWQYLQEASLVQTLLSCLFAFICYITTADIYGDLTVCKARTEELYVLYFLASQRSMHDDYFAIEETNTWRKRK